MFFLVFCSFHFSLVHNAGTQHIICLGMENGKFRLEEKDNWSGLGPALELIQRNNPGNAVGLFGYTLDVPTTNGTKRQQFIKAILIPGGNALPEVFATKMCNHGEDERQVFHCLICFLLYLSLFCMQITIATKSQFRMPFLYSGVIIPSKSLVWSGDVFQWAMDKCLFLRLSTTILPRQWKYLKV